MKHARLVGTALALALVTTLGLSSLFAQSRQRTPPEQPGTQQGKEMVLVGKLVDLQSYMTGQYPTKDQVESYAERKGASVQDVERWLTPNLGYDA